MASKETQEEQKHILSTVSDITLSSIATTEH